MNAIICVVYSDHVRVPYSARGGQQKVDRKILYVNIIIFAKAYKGGGIRRLSTKSG